MKLLLGLTIFLTSLLAQSETITYTQKTNIMNWDGLQNPAMVHALQKIFDATSQWPVTTQITSVENSVFFSNSTTTLHSKTFSAAGNLISCETNPKLNEIQNPPQTIKEQIQRGLDIIMTPVESNPCIERMQACRVTLEWDDFLNPTNYILRVKGKDCPDLGLESAIVQMIQKSPSEIEFSDVQIRN